MECDPFVEEVPIWLIEAALADKKRRRRCSALLSIAQSANTISTLVPAAGWTS